MPTMTLVPVSTDDYRRIAERKLPRFLFDYVNGGALGETTLAKNTADVSNIVPQQREMRGGRHAGLRADFAFRR